MNPYDALSKAVALKSKGSKKMKMKNCFFENINRRYLFCWAIFLLVLGGWSSGVFADDRENRNIATLEDVTVIAGKMETPVEETITNIDRAHSHFPGFKKTYLLAEQA